MKHEVIITNDGSSSIFIPELNEHYHSSHGAIQEAQHVFIAHGLAQLGKNPITLFELGFGTGLNALLTAQFAEKHQIQINYQSIEAFPVDTALLEQLNYSTLLNDNEGLFNALHDADWEKEVSISSYFSLHKIAGKMEDYQPEQGVDLIYFDAFGPRAQAELWHIHILEKMYDALKDGGVLVTYCAQGQFKRDLKSLGFVVESLPGPPGKREMTRAVKSAQIDGIYASTKLAFINPSRSTSVISMF